jgi:CubicO group peptidase (beta-lactamase class C family)
MIVITVRPRRAATPVVPRAGGALLILILVLTIALGGCGGAATIPPATPSPTSPPVPPTATSAPAAPGPAYWPTNGWRTSTPEEQGVDSAQLLRALQRIDQAGMNVRSLTVIRNGYIVMEAYYQPFRPDELHLVASVTKSVIGTLVGIAVQEGKLPSIRQPVLSFFPERTIQNRTPEKEALTVEDLLTMQPGLDCADEKVQAGVEQSADWVQYILDLPMAGPSGRQLVYCTAGVHLLSAILTRATGMSTAAYAQSRLFDPLGIRPADLTWGTDPQGITIGGYGIQTTPRVMAKLGLLYLNQGRWDSTQIVPQAWATSAVQPHAVGTNHKDYGYLFWVYPSHYAAEGMGEQKIMIVPDRNMVVVFTAAIDWQKGAVLEPLLDDYIRPAAQSDTPLSANPTALAALQTKIKTLRDPTQPVPALPATARAISGQRFVLADNDLDMKALTLNFLEGSSTAQATAESSGGATSTLIGMDGAYRVARSGGAAQALRGTWENDHTFVVRQLDLMSIREVEYRLDFSGNTLKAQVRETVFDTFNVKTTGTAP